MHRGVCGHRPALVAGDADDLAAIDGGGRRRARPSISSRNSAGIRRCPLSACPARASPASPADRYRPAHRCSVRSPTPLCSAIRARRSSQPSTTAAPHLNALAGHVRSFAEMMTRRRGQQQLEGWLTAVEADDQPELHSFANGIRRDQQAVTVGLTLPHSSAAVEGNVTKIKMLKRQIQTAPQARHPPPWITPITESAPEPEM
jgi:transposase